MATSQVSEVIQHLRRIVLLRDGAGLTDEQLLENYLSRHDEAALAALVRRHAPMVWGVCRRVLPNHHDAEDAFQATFVVLVRKAASIASRELLASWLYGVAQQTALKARATVAKRKVRERQVTEMPEPAAAGQDLRSDLQPLLDAELSRLPAKYRIVILLCDLEGKTRKEAARQLGLPEGTVASRLTRARGMLARRLAQRGVILSGGVLAAVLTQPAASAGVPTSVVCSTIKAATLVAAGRAAAAGAISVKVAALTEGVMKTMLLTKLRMAVAVLLVLALAAFGGGLLTRRALADQQGRTERRPAVAEGQPNGADEKAGANGTADDKVRSLLKERLATVKEMAAETEKAFDQTGRVPPEDVLQAKTLVLLAELDLCDSDKERIGIHEKIVSLVKGIEEIADTRFKAGKAQRTDLLKARVDRLNAEIALERAKARAATQPK